MKRKRAAEVGDIWRVQQIAAAMDAIRRYLEAHPNASDSLAGVRLWLRDLPEEPTEEVVGIALERLVAQGQVKARAVAGGAVVYGRVHGERRK
jgi:hypothetical protein